MFWNIQTKTENLLFMDAAMLNFSQ